MKKLQLIFIVFTVLTGCFSPGQLVGTGYLTTVSEGPKTKKERVETICEADSFIFSITGIQFNTDLLIGKKVPFWDFSNDRFYVYVEKQQAFARNPKARRRWRAYDEFYNVKK